MVSLVMRPHGRGSAKWLADFGQRLNDYAEWGGAFYLGLATACCGGRSGGCSYLASGLLRKEKEARCGGCPKSLGYFYL